MFDAKICDEIKSYVYALIDLDGVPFYIGKGNGNRCFNHIDEARTNKSGTPKLEAIRAILNANKSVRIDILRHGLDDKTAFEVEAALIDILNLKSEGVNLMAGHGVGRTPVEDIQLIYGAKPLETKDPLLLVKINQQYRSGMSLQEVYEISRWAWPINISRAIKCKYVLGVANGIVRGVFQATAFVKVSEIDCRNSKDIGRVYFDGTIVYNNDYFHTSVKAFTKKGQRGSIAYLNA